MGCIDVIKDQIAERSHQHHAENTTNITLPDNAILKLSLLRCQHRHDKEEENHNSTSIDKDLHDGDKHGSELEIKHREQKQRKNQAKGAIDRVSKSDHADSRAGAGNSQNPKRNPLKCHNDPYSFLLSSSCSSLTINTSRSVCIVP